MPRLADNDPVNDLAAFFSLRTPEGSALLDAVRDTDPADELAVATRLRREHPAELVSAALGQARLRQRAVAKFGAADAGRMFFLRTASSNRRGRVSRRTGPTG